MRNKVSSKRIGREPSERIRINFLAPFLTVVYVMERRALKIDRTQICELNGLFLKRNFTWSCTYFILLLLSYVPPLPRSRKKGLKFGPDTLYLIGIMLHDRVYFCGCSQSRAPRAGSATRQTSMAGTLYGYTPTPAALKCRMHGVGQAAW